MNVLGIETSCDETAVAIVQDGKKIWINLIASQADIHRAYGGVFPEIASRHHIDRLLPLVDQALKETGFSPEKIDLIAVANGPGLMGSLLMGVTAAEALAYAWEKPIVGVNHVEAHLYAPMMGEEQHFAFPSLGVVISGGHTFLAKISAFGDYEIIGTTVDDAIGETFDKVASMLDLPYPGGPHIEQLAKEGDTTYFPFKPGVVKKRPLDFSFSGLKTNVLYKIKGNNGAKTAATLISAEEKKHIAASFQDTALNDIISKAIKASQTFPCRGIFMGGGVTNNIRIRTLFAKKELSIPIFWPPKDLSLDNAAMIAGLGFHMYKTRSNAKIQVFPRMQKTFTIPIENRLK